MSAMWNYLAGYVIIQVKGRGLERFLNHAAKHGVRLADVRLQGPGCLTARVSVAGFYGLHRLVRGQGFGIHILSKHGLPITLSRFRLRKALLFGWVVVLALLLAATRFIWVIRINGCDRVSPAEVMQVLQANSIAVGTPRRGANMPQLGEAVRMADPRVAWASATLKGVVLTINIKEAAPGGPEQAQGGGPTSIYASRAGVITSITALSGKPMVNVGDAVNAGDLLISGRVGTEEAPVYVQARGSVEAKTPYVIYAECGPTLEKSVRTGSTQRLVCFSLMGARLGEGLPFKTCELELEQRRVLNVLLPLEVEAYICHETRLEQAEASVEELQYAALLKAQQEAFELLPKGARLLSKQGETTVLEGGSVRAKLTLIAGQDICETRRITQDDG